MLCAEARLPDATVQHGLGLPPRATDNAIDGSGTEMRAIGHWLVGLWTQVESWAHRDATPWIVAVLSMVIAVTAEFGGDEIWSSTKRLVQGDWGAPYLPAYGFWSLLVVWSVLVVAKAKIEFRSGQRIEMSLLSSRLVRCLRVYPGVVNTIALRVHEMRLLDSEEPETKRKELAKKVRPAFMAIAELAALFAERPLRCYGVNAFVTLAPIKEEAVLEGFQHLMVTHELRHQQVASLCLFNGLTVRAQDMPKRPRGTGAKPFLLPAVEEEETPHGHRQALPGAPTAFLRDGLVVYDSIEDLVGLTGDFDASVGAHVQEHFESGLGLGTKSFLSTKITGSNGVVIGVLNIDCTEKQVLGVAADDAAKEEFLTLIFPLISSLGEIVTMFRDAVSEEFELE